MKSRIEQEVIVVGAGVVGAVSALGLARRGVRVKLVEAHPPAIFEINHEIDLRVFALSPASAAILHSLDCWQVVQHTRACAYTDMEVCDVSGKARLHFDAALIATPQLGWIVENSLLQSVLWQALNASAKITVYSGSKVIGLNAESDKAQINLDDHSTLSANCIIAADGGASPLRNLAGIGSRETDYGQRAIVAHVQTSKPHRLTAWQKFSPGGPLAFLPLADGRCSIVWSLPDADAQRLLNVSDSEFRIELANASAYMLGDIQNVSARASFPLRLNLADYFIAERLALVGDAAHVVHPLAGQGLNMGLTDAAALVDVISDAAQAGDDIGSAEVLQRYAHWRQGDAQLAANAFDQINAIFRADLSPWPQLASAGLNTVNYIRPIKRIFAEHAAGLLGKLPSLAKFARDRH